MGDSTGLCYESTSLTVVPGQDRKGPPASTFLAHDASCARQCPMFSFTQLASRILLSPAQEAEIGMFTSLFAYWSQSLS